MSVRLHHYVPQTKQWVGELKMNGEVGGVAFTPDSRHLLSYGSKPATHTHHLPLSNQNYRSLSGISVVCLMLSHSGSCGNVLQTCLPRFALVGSAFPY